MVIYKRSVRCQKSYEEACAILKSSAYGGEFKIENDYFSLLCSKRTFRGQLMFQRASGRLTSSDNRVEATFEIHGGIELLIAIAMTGCGMFLFLFNLLFKGFDQALFPFLTSVGMGLLIACVPLCRGIEIIDLLEHKLTR